MTAAREVRIKLGLLLSAIILYWACVLTVVPEAKHPLAYDPSEIEPGCFVDEEMRGISPPVLLCGAAYFEESYSEHILGLVRDSIVPCLEEQGVKVNPDELDRYQVAWAESIEAKDVPPGWTLVGYTNLNTGVIWLRRDIDGLDVTHVETLLHEAIHAYLRAPHYDPEERNPVNGDPDLEYLYGQCS